MTTPNKQAIVERATKLWRINRMRNGQPYENTPEESELSEEGFLSVAATELMRSEDTEYKTWLEKEYTECVLGMQATQQNLANTQQVEKPQYMEQPIPFDLNEAMRSGVSVLGGRQCGKTTLANQLTDIIKRQAIVYVIDPSMAWLRRRRDFTVLTIPLRTRHEVNLTWNWQNTIFDTSMLNPNEQRDFTELFAQVTLRGLISIPEQARPNVWLWLEEAHNSLPLWIFHSKQMPELKRLITVGANFNVSFGLITQFAAEVSKLPIKATQQRYFGQTSEPNDLGYIRKFIGKDQAEQLRDLATGEFFYSYRNTVKRFRTTTIERNLNSPKQQIVFSYCYGSA